MDKKKSVLILIWLPVILLAFLNLLTVFTPEIGFDALWYHLTLPKLWLQKRQWFYEGGLLYYSVMPRLAETIFIPLVKYTGFVGPKLVQYLSGIGVGLLIWKITTKLKFTKLQKSVSVSLFYCTWLVSWQSGSAYVDLFRTFLETTALYFLLSKSWLKGGLFLGLAIGTKWLALGSLGIYAIVFGLPLVFPALVLTLPWLYVSFINTGNPIYPIFSSILHQSFVPLLNIIKNIVFLPIIVTLPFDDFFSPVIGILVILASFSFFSRHQKIRKIATIGLLGSIYSVILDPPSSRFLVPYLPSLVIASVYTVSLLKSRFQSLFIYLVIGSSIIIFGMRLVAIKKYLPYLLGHQSINTFLTSYSNRLPDTFIDTDGFVAKNIPKNSKIIIDKLHNLYYFPYNFDHTSWVDTKNGYDYLVTKDTDPKDINGRLLHVNDIGIQFYNLHQ